MRITWADKVVVLVLGIATASLYPALWQRAAEGDTAVVRAPGAADQVVSLSADRELTIHGPLGDSVVEVRGGKIRFKDSPCDGKQCIHSGWLHSAGDFAACLPNRISVLVAGSQDWYDAINF